jgi:hypothetical protein
MTTQDSFAVLTQLTYAPELKDQVAHLTYLSMPVFKRQEGLLYIGMHHHVSEPKMMTYLVWESEEYHLKCMNGQDFSSIMSAWNEMIQSGRAKFEMNSYAVIDSYARHAETIF